MNDVLDHRANAAVCYDRPAMICGRKTGVAGAIRMASTSHFPICAAQANRGGPPIRRRRLASAQDEPLPFILEVSFRSAGERGLGHHHGWAVGESCGHTSPSSNFSASARSDGRQTENGELMHTGTGVCRWRIDADRGQVATVANGSLQDAGAYPGAVEYHAVAKLTTVAASGCEAIRVVAKVVLCSASGTGHSANCSARQKHPRRHIESWAPAPFALVRS